MCQARGDGESEAGATVLARRRGVGLFEGLKQSRALIVGDTDTGVLDLEAHQQFVILLFEQSGAQGNPTVVGELDRVARVIEQCLAQPRRVAAQAQRHGITFEVDPQALAACRFADDRRDAVENRREMEIRAFHLQSAGFDLGQVEDIADDGEEVLRGAVDLVESLGLCRRRSGTPQKVRQADDGVQRRADLVTHVGQERALRLVRGLGRLGPAREFRLHLGDLTLAPAALAVVDHRRPAEEELSCGIAHQVGADQHRQDTAVLAQPVKSQITYAAGTAEVGKVQTEQRAAFGGHELADLVADELFPGVAEQVEFSLVDRDDRPVGGQRVIAAGCAIVEVGDFLGALRQCEICFRQFGGPFGDQLFEVMAMASEFVAH
ncbi:MAG: hypothetical protein AW09_001621 [Candidatus Accumulibacter phosphatis]|uniref:Uncharacterized protein n=1 Tax=Candidatus Accumulibacter phosphatis TaxID=327160 RepID=A0A080LWK5_9PROT|nr:MAG: hypothetical protein AW09_001621 [Candidatus Accumulibacter phosphatis]